MENGKYQDLHVEVSSDLRFAGRLKSLYSRFDSEDILLQAVQTSERGVFPIDVRLGVACTGRENLEQFYLDLLSEISSSRYSIIQGSLGLNGGVLRLSRDA